MRRERFDQPTPDGPDFGDYIEQFDELADHWGERTYSELKGDLEDAESQIEDLKFELEQLKEVK